MGTMSDLAALLGRVALAALFVWSGAGKIAAFASTTASIASKGLPVPQVLAAATIAIELGLGLAIVLGWRTRTAALVMALWLVPTTLLFHAYWAVPAAQKMQQQIQFMKNVSIVGGLLLLVALGPGRMSVDGLRGGTRPRRGRR